MPRQLRIEYPGAIYHIVDRGDRREPIFWDERDYLCILATLSEACAKTDWQVHAFCLMPNHFHLVLETPKANLVAGMHWFLTTYTSRFNRRHRLFGHLFSGRYKASIVDGSGDGYLLTVCDYVHLNPSRAHLLRPDELLREFRWSSWHMYLKKPTRRPSWLRVDRLLGEHGIPMDSAAGREQLEHRLEQRRAHERGDEFKAIRRGWCLGDKNFRRELLERVYRCSTENHHAQMRRETAEEKARRILQEELDLLGWLPEQLRAYPKGDSRKIRIARRMRTETCMTLKWIANQLHMGTPTHVANRLYHTRLDK
jgi:REP-associated tyrosine transposase